ncbi:MAG: endonuclease/exonuclease/phosphatase family protein [Deltaproteobacteria bacterium]|nr:endonuclease/exonuclease/phosphatase family protein [Deltaproteobacteria bacterium]
MLRIVCVVVLAVAACDDPARLRLLSYNVNFGLAGDIAGVRAVGHTKADLVVLQETNPKWERALVETLGRRYPHVRFADPDGLPAGGLGVMSRFPIVALETLPSDGGFFVAWRIVVDSNLGRIQVLNVHLRPPVSDHGNWVVGLFSTRGDRLRELTQHLSRLDTTLPTVIAGDFNEQGDGLALQHASTLGYVDAISQHAGPTRTWEWRLASGLTLTYQLDHILYDARFSAVAARIEESGRSDHRPIWVDLELR